MPLVGFVESFAVLALGADMKKDRGRVEGQESRSGHVTSPPKKILMAEPCISF